MSANGLFVWYCVVREDEARVVAAVRELQAAWTAAMPGLSCELLRRGDERAEQVTLMEIYRHTKGVSPEWQKRIESEAASRLAPWLASERHVEVFAPCA